MECDALVCSDDDCIEKMFDASSRMTGAGRPSRASSLANGITCPLCGGPLRHVGRHDRRAPFSHYYNAALRGERLLDDEAERGVRTWASPAEIARLRLIRRVTRPISRGYEPWRFRVLGWPKSFFPIVGDL
jgi:hypothetical protein